MSDNPAAPLAYRDAVLGDAAALDALFRRQFVDSYSHRYGPADIAAFFAHRTVQQWRETLSDPGYRVHVATAADRLVGYVKLGPMSLPFDTGGRSALELHQLYVLSPWHGAGVGARLTRWAATQAQALGAQDLYLAVFPFQTQARRFYARMGFEELETFPFTLGAVVDDDLICRLPLDRPISAVKPEALGSS